MRNCCFNLSRGWASLSKAWAEPEYPEHAPFLSHSMYILNPNSPPTIFIQYDAPDHSCLAAYWLPERICHYTTHKFPLRPGFPQKSNPRSFQYTTSRSHTGRWNSSMDVLVLGMLCCWLCRVLVCYEARMSGRRESGLVKGIAWGWGCEDWGAWWLRDAPSLGTGYRVWNWIIWLWGIVWSLKFEVEVWVLRRPFIRKQI